MDIEYLGCLECVENNSTQLTENNELINNSSSETHINTFYTILKILITLILLLFILYLCIIQIKKFILNIIEN